MSDSQSVATRDSQPPERHEPPKTVVAVFGDDSFRQQVAAALPKHIGVDVMMRVALTQVRLNPDLQKCTVSSFMASLLQAAQAGLRPGMFGEGWLIPRWNNKTRAMEAQFQPGYLGITQLAYRSGDVASVDAVAVYAADVFKYQLGSDPKIEHYPDMLAEHRDEDIIAFYAVVKLVNGGTIMSVLRRADVDKVRDRHAPRNKAGVIVGPWVTDYEPMGAKTALIRALKLAPKDPERASRLQVALQADQDAVFSDRLASQVVEQRSAASRVAERLGVTDVEPETGEVVDSDYVPDEDGAFSDEDHLDADA